MHTLAVQNWAEPTTPPAAAVTAREVVRRHRDGDTAVEALRGVSIMPARRASRLNVLDALHYE